MPVTPETRWDESAAAAAGDLKGELRPGDVLLVKGSRGVGLEVAVESLLADTEVEA